ncbi:hypothetical protein [Pontibacter ruber]|uniref:Uncharacterized protein n=1 Tax=Pontibacter ruber TaxID=1343895 RepID=A0ABW5CTU0_9BACT|nr:hypothetical protein [Pontibacter ruber]
MKRILAICLLFVFTFNSVGYYFVFIVLQQQIRSEIKNQIKQRIPADELHVIAVSINEQGKLDWKREGKEFLYKGSMYDVVKTETKDDTVFYYCITDVEETQLFAMLDQLVKEHLAHSKKHNSAKKLLKSFYKKFYDNKYVVRITVPVVNYSFLPPVDESLQSLALDIASPPPRLV